MLLSKYAHNLYADFFEQCDFCDKSAFPAVQVYSRRGSWILTKILGVDGITFGSHVFVNPKFVIRDKQNLLRVPKELIAHELVHVIQYRKLGFWGFLRIYIKDFWTIFKAKDHWNLRSWFDSYREIPHEKEARRFAMKFNAWLRKSDSITREIMSPL